MPSIQEDYHHFVEQEDIQINRVETCTETIDAVLEALYHKDGPVHLQTVCDIVCAMHDVKAKLERELLLLRVEKRLAARYLDDKPSRSM